MDPKKPPVPRRVWRMTTDAPQGETSTSAASRPMRRKRGS